MSRTTTAYVSDYQRTREQSVRLLRGEVRTLMANYNGVLESGETITTATWRLTTAGALSAGAIASDGRSTSVTLTASQGCGAIKCEVITSAGRVLPALYRLKVQTPPWFSGEEVLPVGPQTLVVTA